MLESLIAVAVAAAEGPALPLGIALAASEAIGASRLKSNGVVQLGLTVALRVLCQLTGRQLKPLPPATPKPKRAVRARTPSRKPSTK